MEAFLTLTFRCLPMACSGTRKYRHVFVRRLSTLTVAYGQHPAVTDSAGNVRDKPSHFFYFMALLTKL